jgi:hypothetical protein
MPVSFDLGDVQAALEASLRTEDISLISHTHGRERRAQRGIMRRELQAAIKYGLRERANPGRDGGLRWRFTHEGVVYITDETARHEVTSWRIDGKDAAAVEQAEVEVELAGKGSHAVLIVDNSGSMRKDDVPGYKSRAHAVYDCLVRDFVKEQVKTGAAQDVVVSLITMSDKAKVEIKTHPLDDSLIPLLEKIGKRGPRSHGNYIPALDKALELMTADAPNRGSLLLLLFSDGAPSDQQGYECEHGVKVFETDRKADPLMGHRSAGSAWNCRTQLHDRVKTECLDRIRRIGNVFGKEKVVLRTLAFGPPSEDFKLLDEMASALPRGEFQKLGLNANKLRTAFSSLSSSMTELRTEGGGRALTRRDKVVDKEQRVDVSSEMVKGSAGWWIYAFEDMVGKYMYNTLHNKLEKARLSPDANGLAFVEQPFAEGAERFVYRCTEIRVPGDNAQAWYYKGVELRNKEIIQAKRMGLRLVAKEAKDKENLELGRAFHEVFARVQTDAAALAVQFNQRCAAVFRREEWSVTFLPTNLYECYDVNYKDQQAWVLVEPELDGKFTKWNNNAGAVRTGGPASPSRSMPDHELGGIFEDDEEDEDGDAIDVNDVPQAFSHFSYEMSRGKQLVCDLQGVWNSSDGFVLTDPVVHYVSSSGKRHKNGATDKGQEGVKRFFRTHKCGALCKRMLLTERTEDHLLRG